MYYEDSGDPVVEEGLSWDAENKVLTLENYHSYNIGMLLEDNTKLVLKGENIIETDEVFAFYSRGLVEISGEGSLSGVSTDSTSNSLSILGGTGFTIKEGATINGHVWIDSLLIIDGGVWNDDVVYANDNENVNIVSVFVLNDGTVNLKNPLSVASVNQNGGELNIDLVNCEDTTTAFTIYNLRCIAPIYAEYAVFNDGKITIKNNGAVAGIYIGVENGESKGNLARFLAPYGVVLPENGLLEINGGDITIDASSSMMGALMITAENSEDGLYVADGLAIEPEFAKYTTFDMGNAVVGVLSDGEGEAAVSIDPATRMPIVEHVAKKLRIHPKDDDINVPNSGAHSDVDAQASSTLFAVIAGFVVAAITYRTLRKTE